jgi:hypothetical protein
VRRVLPWLPPVAVSLAAACGGYYVGRIVERLGPIDRVVSPARAFLFEAVIALVAASLAVAVRRSVRWETGAVAATLAVAATCLGTYGAFNTIAGSRDCPGTQDCDTLIVPLLTPLFASAAGAAVVGAVMTLALLRRRCPQ